MQATGVDTQTYTSQPTTPGYYETEALVYSKPILDYPYVNYTLYVNQSATYEPLFRLQLDGLGQPNSAGLSPASFSCYINGSLASVFSVYPGQTATCKLTNNVVNFSSEYAVNKALGISVYVNSTFDGLYSGQKYAHVTLLSPLGASAAAEFQVQATTTTILVSSVHVTRAILYEYNATTGYLTSVSANPYVNYTGASGSTAPSYGISFSQGTTIDNVSVSAPYALQSLTGTGTSSVLLYYRLPNYSYTGPVIFTLYYTPPSSTSTVFSGTWTGTWDGTTVNLTTVPNHTIENLSDATLVGYITNFHTTNPSWSCLNGENINVWTAPSEYPGVYVVHNGLQGAQCTYFTATFTAPSNATTPGTGNVFSGTWTGTWQGSTVGLTTVKNNNIEDLPDRAFVGYLSNFHTTNPGWTCLNGEYIAVWTASNEYPGVYVVHNGDEGPQCTYFTATFPLPTNSTTTVPISTTTILANSSAYTLILKPGWNLVSTPIKFASPDPYTSTCQPQYPFWMLKNDTYFVTDLLFAGEGYWIYSASACMVEFSSLGLTPNATPLANVSTSNLTAGWNLIGPATNNQVQFSNIMGSCNVIDGPYGFNTSADSYYYASTFYPGQGYFVEVNVACSLGNGISPPPPP